MNEITIINEKTINTFWELNEENGQHIAALDRWLKKKKTIMPCYAVYGFNKDGELHLKQFLADRKNWFRVDKVDESVGLL